MSDAFDASYKELKEASVTGLTGSTIWHVNFISSVGLASIVLNYALASRFSFRRTSRLLLSWALLVLPLLLSMTIMAESPLYLFWMLVVPALVILLKPQYEFGTPLPQRQCLQPEYSSFRTAPLPSLTVYRAHMMLMTILAILAVDFPVFPRELAKCETFGVSLMDLGVGSFVFSQGVVSAIPLLRNSSYIVAPTLPKLVRVVRKCIPVIALGVVRVMLVKGTDYPEHESEYGAHWNFFITLALLPVMEVFLHPILGRFSISFLGLLIALLQQIFLSYFGLEHYILDAPRIGLISANKEGIISLLGYFSIHLMGLAIGTLSLGSSPSHFRRIQSHIRKGQDPSKISQSHTLRQTGKIATELCGYAIAWWAATFFVNYLEWNVSRRMVNISYILWVCAFNVSFILGNLLVNMFFSLPTVKKKNMIEATMLPAPELFEAINKNGLALFLIANVGTGIVNLSMHTLYVSHVRAMAILCVYSFMICAVAWQFRKVKILPV